jgi:hypothetical protein
MLGSCECGSELSGVINCGEFLDWLRTCCFLKKDFTPLSLVIGGMGLVDETYHIAVTELKEC